MENWSNSANPGSSLADKTVPIIFREHLPNQQSFILFLILHFPKDELLCAKQKSTMIIQKLFLF